jgi:hypothetical protein
VKCNTVEGKYSTTPATGYGGTTVAGCSVGYIGVGKVCLNSITGPNSPVGSASTYQESLMGCNLNGDVVYAPIDLVQNAVLKAALQAWVSKNSGDECQLTELKL